MQEKDISDLVSGYINNGFSASEIRERIATLIDKETLEELWSIPRKNINDFIAGCLSGLILKPPFLDLGCGRRSLKPEIQQIYGENTLFIGIDHYLPPKEGNQPQRLPNIIAQADNLPIADGSIGSVFCMELLEHVPDIHGVLGEIGRVTCPYGYLVLSLPGLDVPKHDKLPFQRDYRRISPEQSENLLRDNGFRNIKVKTKTFRSLQTNLFVIARRATT